MTEYKEGGRVMVTGFEDKLVFGTIFLLYTHHETHNREMTIDLDNGMGRYHFHIESSRVRSVPALIQLAQQAND